MGTDYPFDIDVYDIEDLLDKMPDLDNTGHKVIRSKNTERIVNL